MSHRTPPILATEEDYTSTLMDGAQRFGWITFHVRAAMRQNGGWWTPVTGNGVGFPDLLLIHPKAKVLWFVEVKRDDAPKALPPAQAMWREVLAAAGAVHHVWRVPSELNRRLGDLADVANTKS